jgi:hypothetical protein
MSTRVYCTYCDHRYLPRALALIQSIRAHGSNDQIWVLCLSDQCFETLSSLAPPGVHAVPLHQIERAYPDLLASKSGRETIEYYYTCTATLTHYVLGRSPDAQWVTYLDSDLWFFQSPDLVFETIGNAPVAIIPHNFTPHNQKLEKFGKYNVGWVTFDRSEEGQRCLDWWRQSCIEWCYGRIEGDKFADQRYLDRFSSIAPHTAVIHHKGCNLAPWNIGNYAISLRDTTVFADEDPLIFFHFHGIKKSGAYYFDNHRSYGAPCSRITRNHIYKPYVEALVETEQVLARNFQFAAEEGIPLRGARLGSLDVKNLARNARRLTYQMLDLIEGRPLLVRDSRIT